MDDPSVTFVFHLVPPELQNLLHIPMFGGLAWLWHWSLRGWLPAAAPLGAIAFVITAGYGIIDEIHQLTVPGRYASLTDIALNTLGAAVALWLITARIANGNRA